MIIVQNQDVIFSHLYIHLGYLYMHIIFTNEVKNVKCLPVC